MAGQGWLQHIEHHHRYRYRSPAQISKQRWPNGKGLALYVAMNLEHFAFGNSEGAKIAPSNQLDVLNYAWRDYGNRVGAWHLVDLFKRLNIPPALLCNTSLLDYCPELVDAWLACEGSELIGHGHTNSERQGELEESEESDMVRYCRHRLQTWSGQNIRGWLSPWISESTATPELLARHGYGYTLNWAHDDMPSVFHTREGELISVPYPQEINDIPTIVPNGASIETFCAMIEGQFAELLERSQHTPQVMGIALHPYIVGQPFRFHLLKKTLARILEQRDQIWLTTPGKIAEHFQA
ncbi:polysaccharide deacetylase [Carnimonas nigrificans]|uniref:polysaccharide deacetylase n=1 Tax=Carnimonas nigrificans TaxID=64323 RepID=UPI0004AE251F|nr:polysaccharide deacetylase [Carnimonas nigrificans]